MTQKIKVNLASKSPRRRQLLSKIFNNINALAPEFVEPLESEHSCPEEYIKRCVSEKISQLKQSLGASEKAPSELYFVADTTVALGKKILGKPRNPAEARHILKLLSGRTHKVYTGFWLGTFGNEQPEVVIEQSEIEFKKLSSREISEYVRSGDPLDKAGAYGFQGAALRFVKRVRGSYTNIMGLPVERVRTRARELGLLKEHVGLQ